MVAPPFILDRAHHARSALEKAPSVHFSTTDSVKANFRSDRVPDSPRACVTVTVPVRAQLVVQSLALELTKTIGALDLALYTPSRYVSAQTRAAPESLYDFRTPSFS